MPTNFFGKKDGGLRWDERLVRNYFLGKIDGLNDAEKRHDSLHYVGVMKKHCKWSAIFCLGAIISGISVAIDGAWSEVKGAFFIFSAAVYWLNTCNGIREMFSGIVREIDMRVKTDATARERFAKQQAGVDQRLEERFRQHQAAAKLGEITDLQNRLQKLHVKLGIAIDLGRTHEASVIRGEIARTESELRSRGH